MLAISNRSRDRVGSRALFRLPCHLITSNELGFFVMDRRWDACRMCCGCGLRVVLFNVVFGCSVDVDCVIIIAVLDYTIGERIFVFCSAIVVCWQQWFGVSSCCVVVCLINSCMRGGSAVAC